MSSSRYRRLATVVSTALLGALLLGTGTAFAATPGWKIISFVNLPQNVTPGADAGYSFTIQNNGKSNISQLFFTDSINAVPTYFTSTRAGCTISPRVFCTFGALNAGDTIDIVIAYTTPTTGTSFSGTMQLNSTGQTFSDSGGTSHGDTYNYPFSTGLKSSPNFDGAFEQSPQTRGTSMSLSKRNPQAGTVTPPSSNFGLYQPVTIEEGVPAPADDPCLTVTCIGEWTQIHVGTTGTLGPVHVTLLIYGQTVKGNPSLTTGFALYHEGSSPNPITLNCSDPTSIPSLGGSLSGAECITVTMQGTNYLIDAWLLHNGNVRGLLG